MFSKWDHIVFALGFVVRFVNLFVSYSVSPVPRRYNQARVYNIEPYRTIEIEWGRTWSWWDQRRVSQRDPNNGIQEGIVRHFAMFNAVWEFTFEGAKIIIRCSSNLPYWKAWLKCGNGEPKPSTRGGVRGVVVWGDVGESGDKLLTTPIPPWPTL